ncbi:FtsX-like permease family protein [Streptomyces sp. E11-3]|uniref:FtsX-like permease family protein n=1 Tax=Streptomyces sp. E11-3 TaxID=3110112 RepID=UPI0039801092
MPNRHASVAPWVRTRLRAAPGAAVALFVLVLVTSFLAAVFPRGVDAYEDRGLRGAIADAGVLTSTVAVTTPVFMAADSEPGSSDRMLHHTRLRDQYEDIVGGLPAPLRADLAEAAYGARTAKPQEATDSWLPRPDGLAPQFTLATQADVGKHARVVDGRLPTTAGKVTSRTRQAEAAVTARTAKSLKLKVGSVVHFPGFGDGQRAVRISGIVEPLRPDGSYWAYESELRTPTLASNGDPLEPLSYWLAGLLLAPDAGPFLLGFEYAAEAYWRLPPAVGSLTAHDPPALKKHLASLEKGPLFTELSERTGSRFLTVSSGLGAVLTSYGELRDAVTPVVAVAAFGIGTVAAIVLLMAGRLAAARRHDELRLLRARGGSVRGMAGRLFAETLVVAVPAAALGWLLARLAVSEGRTAFSLLGSAAVAAFACAALPVQASLAHRRLRAHGGRDDVTTARPSARRTVAELTGLVLAVGAVAALLRRGTDEADPLVSAAPVLVSLIAALVLVRLYPLPLRWALRPLVRRRGAIGFLALARAGRAPAAQTLPLLALLTALSMAAFGGSVLAGVADARDRAALFTVGADIRVDGPGAPLPDSLAGQLGKVAGVREVAAVHLDEDLELPDSSFAHLVAVDPRTYARLARETGLGSFTEAELAAPRSGTLPAIASPQVAELLGGREHSFKQAAGYFTARVVGVRETTPALPDGEFLLIDGRQLPHLTDSVLLASGSGIDTAAVRETVDAAGKATIGVRADEYAALADSPLQSGAERLYAAAVAAGAGYAALTVLLSLLQSARERGALVARLRTMGLGKRQARWLLVWESLPQALLAAGGGALVGWSATVLLAPGIDLGRIALAARTGFERFSVVQLRADPWSLLLPALGVVVLATGVSLVQAWWTARRTATTELRAGDSR